MTAAMPWELRVPTRVIFGSGMAAQLPGMVADQGRRSMIFVGGDPERHADLLAMLPGTVTVHTISGEPTLETVKAALQRASTFGPDVVVGLGGGSVIDTAKAVGGLLGQAEPVETFLEVVGAGRAVEVPGVPVIAVPTTAGAGAEVTGNAVLAVVDRSVKVSLRGPGVYAQTAVIDPLLTLACPPFVTASSGMDALAQCLEPLVSAVATPFSDAFAEQGLRYAAGNIRHAYASGADLRARTKMCLASTLGGLALTHAKLGAVHGLAGVLGGMLGAPHGAICARLLAPVVATTLHALMQRCPDGGALGRYQRAAALCIGDGARADQLAPWLEDLADGMRVPRLYAMGWRDDLTASTVAAAQRSSSMRGHPITLDGDELAGILSAAA